MSSPRHASYRESSEEVTEGSRYQSQLLWTILVAIAVAITAFFQVTSPRSRMLSRDALDSFQGSPVLIVPAARDNATDSVSPDPERQPAQVLQENTETSGPYPVQVAAPDKRTAWR